MLTNLVIAQLSEVLKWQIENNDAYSIQLKLWTQVDVDVETTLKKILINCNHVHVQVCKFKIFKELLPRPCYSRDAKIKCGAIAEKATCKYIK